MNKRHIAIVSLAAIASMNLSRAYAQEAQYRYADAIQLWRLTDNAAGLSLDSAGNRGVAYFDGQQREGDYHRIQEGRQHQQLEFYTEKYQKISPILVGYGSFSFDMGRTKDRAWCDAMRPYNSNPYYSGSSVPGKYDTQQFDLTAAVGTTQLRGITAGMRMDYKVSDLSRLRDPRSRSKLLDYRVTPSLTYTSEPHTIGLSGHYNRRKEQMPTLTTVQTDPNLMYYEMYGMEQAIGSVGAYASFSREWVNHAFGAQLSYGYNNGQTNSLTTIGIQRGSESIYEKEKHEPGHYTSYQYTMTSHNRIKNGKLLHLLDFMADWTQAYADEYRQQRIQTNDPETGLTSYHYETLIEYKKRYQVRLLEASLHYRCSMVDSNAITGYLGLKGAFSNAMNKRLLPESSLQYNHMNFTIEGGKSFFKNCLWIDAETGYHFKGNADLQLADATTDYAQQVLLPDMVYYNANYWHGHLAMTYQFFITAKGTHSEWFVRIYGDYLKTNNNLHNSNIGASIGVYY